MHRCYGCMRETQADTCPRCGWSADRDNEFHQLPVGTVLLERYTVGRVLGQGGFGITYLGWDAQQEQTVAVKEFYPGSLVNRENTQSLSVRINSRSMEGSFTSGRDRFLREARALAKLKDVPQIVGIHDSFPENGTAYIVMEYIRGVELRRYVAMKGGRLETEETFRILEPILRALETVHATGLVHRDISPDNIMLDPMGGAKLLDFGAVRTVEHPDAEKDMTHSTEAIVKHGFAPMEQYRGRGSLGPWTDEYALCATVYYCLTGRIPPDAMARAMEEEALDWSGVPDLTPRRRKALEKGMAVKAKDRFPDMKSLREALYGKDRPAPKPEEHKEEKPPVREAPQKERPPKEEKPRTVHPPKAEEPEKVRPPKEKPEKVLPPKAERPKKERPEKAPRPIPWKPVLIAAAVLALIAAAVLLPDRNKEELTPAEPQVQTVTEPAAVPGDDIGPTPSVPEESTVPVPEEPATEPVLLGAGVLMADPLSALPMDKKDIAVVVFLKMTDRAGVESYFLEYGYDIGELSEATDLSADGDGSVLAYSDGRFLAICAENGVDGSVACPGLFAGCERLELVRFGDAFHTENATSMEDMFLICRSLHTVDVENLDTSNVTTMRGMFDMARNDEDFSYYTNANEVLTALDVSGWDVSKVEDMSRMFVGCKVLKDLDVSLWDVGDVRDMTELFRWCEGFESLAVGDWDVSNVRSLHATFSGCKALKILDVGRWDTSNAEDLSVTFAGCETLQTLDVNNWDVSKVSDMDSTFSNMRSIRTLDLRGWDTSAVTSMGWMFHQCVELRSLDLSSWDTGNVDYMRMMFDSCIVLQRVDVSGWDVSNVYDMNWMFNNCSHYLQIVGVKTWELAPDVAYGDFAREGLYIDGKPWQYWFENR